MNIRSLETFYWIAQLGSFRAAARKIFASQPSVSARISSLENELGVDLFDRTGRHAVLTPKGQQALAYAERILKLHAEMLETVARPDAIQGTLRLGVAETIVYTGLSRLIERINERYPSLNLELDIDISVNLADKLLERKIDIAYLVDGVHHEGFINKPFCRYGLVWVASPAMPLPDRPVTLEELARIPIITYPRRSEPYANIRSLLGPRSPSTQIHSSSSLSTIIQMTVDGIGVSALPLEIVTDELARGTLRRFDIEATLPDLRFNVAYSADAGAHIAQAVAALSHNTQDSSPTGS